MEQRSQYEMCPRCGPPRTVDADTSLRLVHLGPEDADRLADLYGELHPADLTTRFLAGPHLPGHFSEGWASLEERGGFVLGAEWVGPDGVRLVGEAGYALLDDGDGELGITVHPEARGGLGTLLLDVLLAHAADRGVPNLQAVVLADNHAMLALAVRRGSAVLDHPEWSVVRFTMSTSGSTPSWPGSHDRPRVLVESDRTRWGPEASLREAGYEVMICSGSCADDPSCPILDGERCSLVEGADAVVVDLPDGSPRTDELVAGERLIHPGVRLIPGRVAAADGGRRRRPDAEIHAELEALLDAADPPTTERRRPGH